MTTEELKAHRRAICKALIEGKQCQVFVCGSWVDHQPQTVACRLFSDQAMSEAIRIKPEPRKVWIGWHAAGSALVDSDEAKAAYKWHAPVKWQLVEEPE